MAFKRWRLAAALLLIPVINATAQAQEIVAPGQQRNAMKRLLRVIRTRPYYGLDWHDLKLATDNEQTASDLKNALSRSGRSAADIAEQSLWVDAAAGHPEAALAFYDQNVLKHPEDKTLPNAACYARAAHGLDLKNAIAVCNAALTADREGYTLVFRGMAELQLGLFAAALKDFDEALSDKTFQSHPMVAEAVYGRGVARTHLGDAAGRKDVEVATRASSRVAATFADIGIGD